MASTIGWELYRSFLGVMKEGSLSGAARALGVSQPTVGRHVAALEKALGVPLFTRSQTGFAPTEAAQSLCGHVEAMESTASALERTAASQGDGVSGVVRVSASEVIAVEVLAPIVARLREVHSALTVELVASNRVQDLLRREADIAVRMTLPRQELLVARRIGHVDIGLHAHPRYLAARGKPRNPSELAGHSLIGFDRESAFVRSAMKSVPGLRRDSFSIRTDSDLAQLALIRAGAGIGFCQVAIARREGLVRLLPRQFTLALDTWITMHEDLRNSPRCRVTFDALVEGMQRHIAAPLQ
ncbi:MAG: LysR family transcriptional regulator [Pseudomonadota bacterium]